MVIDTKFVDVSGRPASDRKHYCEVIVSGGEEWLMLNGPILTDPAVSRVHRVGPAHFPLVPYRTSKDCAGMAAFAASLGAAAVVIAGGSAVRLVLAVGHPVVTAADAPQEAVVYLGFAVQLR